MGTSIYQDTPPIVGGKSVSWFTYTGEGTFLIHTLLFTTTIIRQTLIHIITRAAIISIQSKATSTTACVAPWIVRAMVGTTSLLQATLVSIQTGLSVYLKDVSFPTGADGSSILVATTVGTSSIVDGTAVYWLQFYPVA